MGFATIDPHESKRIMLPSANAVSYVESFRDLVAWQRAIELAHRVYHVTERFPARERFGLASQMRRAAVSIPSNIAEGHRRRTTSYAYHLEIALGSNGELDTQCEIAVRLKFVAMVDYGHLNQLVNEVGRLTRALMRAVNAHASPHRAR